MSGQFHDALDAYRLVGQGCDAPLRPEWLVAPAMPAAREISVINWHSVLAENPRLAPRRPCWQTRTG